MKVLSVLNCAAWLGNAVVWGFYSHVPLMAIASLLAALAAGYIATRDSYY